MSRQLRSHDTYAKAVCRENNLNFLLGLQDLIFDSGKLNAPFLEVLGETGHLTIDGLEPYLNPNGLVGIDKDPLIVQRYKRDYPEHHFFDGDVWYSTAELTSLNPGILNLDLYGNVSSSVMISQLAGFRPVIEASIVTHGYCVIFLNKSLGFRGEKSERRLTYENMLEIHSNNIFEGLGKELLANIPENQILPPISFASHFKNHDWARNLNIGKYEIYKGKPHEPLGGIMANLRICL